MSSLTEEEKIVKKYYEFFVESKVPKSKTETKKLIKSFCEEFSKASILGTRYEDNKITIGKTSKRETNGSMSTFGGKGKKALMRINTKRFIRVHKINSENKNQRFEGFFKLVETANHELRHFFQGKDNGTFKMISNGISFGEALDYSYEDVSRATDKDFYSSKIGNYHNVMKEGDARRVGCLNACNQIINAISRLKVSQVEIMMQNLQESIEEDNIEYEKLKFPNEKVRRTRSDVTRTYSDEALATYPQKFLDRFPVLNYEYEESGSRKSIETLWKEKSMLEQNLKSNMKIKEDTKDKLGKQLHIGYSKIFFNAFKELNDFEKKDIVARFGHEKIDQIIKYTIDGRQKELIEREKHLKSYYYVVRENDLEEYVNKYKFDEAVESYRRKAGYGSHFDFVEQKNYIGFENDETKFLKSFGQSIKYIKCNRYTPEEKARADALISDIKQKRLEENKKKYIRRIKAKQSNNIFSIIKRKIYTKSLPASREEENLEFELQNLVVMRDEALKYKKLKQEKKDELSNIKNEVDNTLKKVNAQKYLEKKENNIISFPEDPNI